MASTVAQNGDALLDIPVETIDGEATTLAVYRGSVLLVVNVASKCGLTPQYEALEALYRRNRGDGFVVLGFPANDFGEQEPGTNEDIAAFCADTTPSTSRCSRRSACSARGSIRSTPR